MFHIPFENPFHSEKKIKNRLYKIKRHQTKTPIDTKKEKNHKIPDK
jgi:hypothetical protein